jgi:hypothetical protein
MSAPVVWLASYPRSGNTFLRTVLYQCFGMRSASIYRDDLGGQKGIEELAGHIEHAADGRLDFGDQPLQLIKTHAVPFDGRPAIYVLRDGRDAVVSLYHFLHERHALSDIVEGKNHFGSWGDHVTAWQPLKRPNTLLLRYEDLVNDLASCVGQIADYLQLTPTATTMPPRDELAKLDGHWIRPESAEKQPLDGPVLQRFWEVNGPVMQEFGYW